MRLAIVGSRDYPDKKGVWEFLQQLKGMEGLHVVTGDARGVDEWVIKGTETLRITCESFAADWNGPLGKAAGFKRNEQLVANCDKLVAFWDVASTGTAHAIRCAFSSGKLGKIITPFGVLKPENQGKVSSAQPPEQPEPEFPGFPSDSPVEEVPPGAEYQEPSEGQKAAEPGQGADSGLIWSRLDFLQKQWETLHDRVTKIEQGLGM